MTIEEEKLRFLQEVETRRTFSVLQNNQNEPNNIRKHDTFNEQSKRNYDPPSTQASNLLGGNQTAKRKKTFFSFSEFVANDSDVLYQRQLLMQQNVSQKRKALCDFEEASGANFNVKNWHKFDEKFRRNRQEFTVDKSNQRTWSRILLPTRKLNKKYPDPLCNQKSKLVIGLILPCISSSDTLHLVKLCVIDKREELAIKLIKTWLPSIGVLKKTLFKHVINEIFLRALDREMDGLAMLILESGYPPNLNAPIFGLNSRRFPSYFLVMINLGRERLVRWMIDKFGVKSDGQGRAGETAILIDKATFFGFTPFMVAQCCRKGKGSVQICKILIDAGASVSKPLSFQLYYKAKTFMRLFEQSQATVQQENLKITTSPSHSHSKPRTVQSIYRHSKIFPIDISCALHKYELVYLILDGLRRLNSLGTLCESDFCLLAQDDVDLSLTLLKLEPKLLNQRDPRGNTLLHLAARQGRVDLITLYLYYNLSIDSLNGFHSTPLHEAALQTHRAAVQYLISRGVNCSIKNSLGLTALELARRQGISSEELYDFFHSRDTIERTEDKVGGLVERLELLEMNQEKPKRQILRFSIEKIIKIPQRIIRKSWLTLTDR